MKLYYSDDYTASAHAFDTTRKSAEVARSLMDRPIPGVEIVAPDPVTANQLGIVHDREYIGAVRTGNPRTLAESQGFEWDPGLWTATTASTGGIVAAAQAALDDGVAGSLSSGLHHAHRNYGSGFCTFNGLVLAAKLALTTGKAKTALIVDWDAHCGGGTSELIVSDSRIWQCDVTVSPFDHFEESDRSTLTIVDDGDRYLFECEDALSRIDRAGPAFDLVIYNAGMDPHEGCAVGGLDGITGEVLAAREHLLFGWAQRHDIPVAFALAGGYQGAGLSAEELVDLHRLTIDAAAGVAAAV